MTRRKEEEVLQAEGEDTERVREKRRRDKSGNKVPFGSGDCRVVAFALKSKWSQELQE